MTKELLNICCITYNHGKYIDKTLKGFFMQKTNFLFNIIIHDDASTDNTRDIIEKYKVKYPNKIKTIYQKENQYSKGIKTINPTFVFPHTDAKYIALCEGDDYWIDENKLQTQIDEMEKNPNCNMSFHPAFELINNKYGKILSKHSSTNKIFSANEIIMGDGGFCPTASLIFRKEALDNLPKWFNQLPVGDYFLQILGSLKGGALFINKPMSIYRINTSGGWSNSIKNFEKKEKYLNAMITGCESINKHIKYQYNNEFSYIKSVKMCELGILYLRQKKIKKFKNIIKEAYKINKNKNLKFYIFYYLSKFPTLFKVALKIKGI